MVSFRFHLALAAWLIATALTAAEPSADLLDRWFAAQQKLQTWRADFVQTRTLKALSNPLSTPGKAMFQAPNEFRWELGQPAQTVAIRGTNEMVVLYPNLSRAERYPVNAEQAGRYKDLLVLLEAGFPRDRKSLEASFRIMKQTTLDGRHEVVLQPRSSNAKRLMPELKLSFRTSDLSLLSTEMVFSDGSTMRTEFKQAEQNPKLEAGLFSTAIPAGYQVSDPMKSR
ncbi:MAG: LolA family protein [Verrucomicrobia bacterium]|jgi:outer membrane lipoprotein-sorting protein|nr:LolA family protein [Verrucomicrobiota bacterium]